MVLVSLDTVRADHLGAYGYAVDTSPNLDSLARKSVLFEDAISQAPWTLPAHGSMMTGLYPSQLDLEFYPARRTLPTGPPMLAEAFQQAGYATAGFSGGGFVSEHFGFDRGFDVYSSKGRRFEHNLQDALGWLESHAGGPFFLFLHGYDAHRPYVSRAVDKAAVGLDPQLADKAGGYCGPERAPPDDLDSVVRYYDASIHQGDRHLGSFLRKLDELGLMTNTVILVTSDHGEEFFEHGGCDHVYTLYRELLEVPFVLYVPQLAERGRRVPELVPASISVGRTLLDVVGVEADLAGPSLLPALVHGALELGPVFSSTDSAPGPFGSRGPSIAMTTRANKLILYTKARVAEAFDRMTDRQETRVLPASDSAYRGRSVLLRWHREMAPLEDDQAAAGGVELSDDLRRELRALGYVD